jgi:hypothetical protein
VCVCDCEAVRERERARETESVCARVCMCTFLRTGEVSLSSFGPATKKLHLWSSHKKIAYDRDGVQIAVHAHPIAVDVVSALL